MMPARQEMPRSPTKAVCVSRGRARRGMPPSLARSRLIPRRRIGRDRALDHHIACTAHSDPFRIRSQLDSSKARAFSRSWPPAHHRQQQFVHHRERRHLERRHVERRRRAGECRHRNADAHRRRRNLGPTTVNGGALIVDTSSTSPLITVNSGATSGAAALSARRLDHHQRRRQLRSRSRRSTRRDDGHRQSRVPVRRAYNVQVNPATASTTIVSGTASLAGTVNANFAPGTTVLAGSPF